MKWILTGLAALLLAAGCAKESSLPTPSGKGTIRAVNAIANSPNVAFSIEERGIGTLGWKAFSGGVRFDDFEYNFNFDTALAGNLSTTRVATVTQKVDAGRDYTFVLTGNLASPTVTTWEADEPQFGDSATTFLLRFGHLAPTLGDLDVYAAEAGVDPVAGMAIATVSNGAVSDYVELESASLVITVTENNDPGAIVYQTNTLAYNASTAYFLTIFDGDPANAAPYELRLATNSSGANTLTDARVAPTVRIMQTAMNLPSADVYQDEALTDLLAEDLAFGDITGDLEIDAGTTEFTITAADNAGSILLEGSLTTASGVPNNVVIFRDEAEFDATSYVADRRPVSTYAKLRVFNSVSNFEGLDLYLVDADEPIDDAIPRQGLGYPSLGNTLTLAADSYDLYVTEVGEKTVVAGPERLDLALGDSVEVLLLDTADPATAEIVIVPPP